ncbi:MAG: CPBP family intramembrane metalloprotease [Turicibacter sp.]|nr:CPBP family intramembrane metalloprotease [Turicibacter sp.]
MFALSSTWNETVKKRVVFVVMCGLVFGLVHLPGGGFAFLFASASGILLCAAYVYSKNLIICIIAHWIPNAINSLIAAHSENFNIFDRIASPWVIATYPIFLAFAIYLTVKAEKFAL